MSAVVSAELWRGSLGDLGRGGASEGLKHHGERFGCGSAQRNEFTEYSRMHIGAAEDEEGNFKQKWQGHVHVLEVLWPLAG